MNVELPPDASADEAAAIAAVIRTYIAESADDDDEPATDWNERRWRFTGRVDSLQGRRIRAPTDAPSDPWAAASRTARMPQR